MIPARAQPEGETRAGLHLRARAFIQALAEDDPPAESFDALALAIASYQAENCPAYARLAKSRGKDPKKLAAAAELAAVPTDAFKLTRIAAHPPEDDAIVFRTSGTTRDVRGAHAMSTVATYEAAALAWGAWALFPDRPKNLRAILLVPSPSEANDSSLSFMLDRFARKFARETTVAVVEGRLDMERLVRACREARGAGAPAALMGTSFAFVHALDALGAERLPLPEGSRIVHTGGYKGRSREVSQDELRTSMARAFDLDERCVIGEYGMTELSSQLYEGTLRARLGLPTPSDRSGVFIPPPWMRVTPVDGDALGPVVEGAAGILRFEDMANVDAALAVQTADLGVVAPGGIRLLGRSPGAPLRGCSIAADELLGRGT